MNGGLVLGVDGGNTKTDALLAREDGTIVGRAIAGCSDIYGAESPEAAVAELKRAIDGACRNAGARVSDVVSSALSLAGADWPEDFQFLECQVRLLGLRCRLAIVNDAFGSLRAGSSSFTGVSIVCGTGAATGARSPSGATWHTSWWQEPHGARELGQKALRAVCRAALGVGPPTSMTAGVLESYGADSVEALLHEGTARGHAPFSTEPAARVLTREASLGDEVATDVLRAHGSALGAYGAAAARRVGLTATAFPLVLAGSVLMASETLRISTIEAVLRHEPGAEPVAPSLSPVAGALLLAFDALGLAPDRSSWNP